MWFGFHLECIENDIFNHQYYNKKSQLNTKVNSQILSLYILKMRHSKHLNNCKNLISKHIPTIKIQRRFLILKGNFDFGEILKRVFDPFFFSKIKKAQNYYCRHFLIIFSQLFQYRIHF